ncbi:MAG: hypothetical protein EXS49_02010 [Candidatus Pacebacteria bacterium]|nr:hypothetical protein [Candidatus Paceibacterota bacterium]
MATIKLHKKILFNSLFLGIIIFFNIPSFSSAAAVDFSGETGNKPKTTQLSVPIPVDCDRVPLPGEISSSTGNCYKRDIGGLVDIVTTMYRFAVGAGTFLAIIMIVIGGIQYTASEVVGSKEDAKKKIYNAIYGLILLAVSIPILKFINPNITILDESEIINIQKADKKYEQAYLCATLESECSPGKTLIDYGDKGDSYYSGYVKQCDQFCKWQTIIDTGYVWSNSANPDNFFAQDSDFTKDALYKRSDLCSLAIKRQCSPANSTISYEIVTGSDNIKAEKKHFCTNYCEDIIEYRRCINHRCILEDYNIDPVTGSGKLKSDLDLLNDLKPDGTRYSNVEQHERRLEVTQ